MISVKDVNNLNKEDEVAIAREEAKIDEVLSLGFPNASARCINVDAPKGLNAKSLSALEKKYIAGGWYIKKYSDYRESFWQFYATVPAEDYSK